MSLVLTLPLIVPFLTAVMTLLAARQHCLQRFLGVTGAAALLMAAVGLLCAVWQEGFVVAQVGGWPAPFGVSLVADMFSAMLVVLTGLVGFMIVVYSLVTIDPERETFGYYPLLHLMLMGTCGAFLTGDIFNLYVWVEVLVIASFVLLTLGGERAQIEGAVKYVIANLLSSILFLVGVGLLYGLTGTLNMADLARTLQEETVSGLATTVATVLLVAFGIKAAIFPLFFWLPASYHTPPPAVSAFFAGLSTKVGVYALIRGFTLLFVQDISYTHTLILILAGCSMITGVLGAVAQTELRRILSFQIIGHTGYMVMGLGLFTPFALAGSVFYIAHDMLVKTNLFLLSGIIHHLRGTSDLKTLGGLLQSYPFLALLFLISALSLAGIPPLSGFFAKLALVQAGLELGRYTIVAVALGTALLTLFSMTTIWNEAFWKPAPSPQEPAVRESRLLLLPVVGLAMLTLTFGLAAELIFTLSLRAAEQLMNPAAYIRAVLGAVSS